MATRLIIDSASDISKTEAESLGITMLPMAIRIEDEEYLDGVNLLPNEFYEKLTSSKDLPKTSQINAYTFDEEFSKLIQNGDDVVCITISSKLSGTYNSALQASKNYEGKVFVVDSLNACIGERLLGQYALRLIQEGLNAKEVAEKLEEEKSRIKVIALIDTLEYLQKGGRLSKAAAFIGGLISLKPVVAVIDGEVGVVGKALGVKKGYAQINSLVLKSGGIDFDMPYCLAWSGNDESYLDKYVADSGNLWQGKRNVPRYVIGGTIGTHIGPGAVGVAFFEKVEK